MKRLSPILLLAALLTLPLLPALPSRAGTPAPRVFTPPAPAPAPAFTPAGQAPAVVAGPPGPQGLPGLPGPAGKDGAPGLGLVGVNAQALPLAMQLMGFTACKADGASDDLSALQNISDYCYANGLPLLLPPGNYLLRGTLYWMRTPGYHNGWVVRGLAGRSLPNAGPGQNTGVVLTEGIAGQKAVVELGPGAAFGNRIEGLTIDGGPVGFNTKYALWSRYENWSQLYAVDDLFCNAQEAVAITADGIPGLGSGAAATATADADHHIVSITLTNGGTGYDPKCPPYVVVNDSSVPAFYSATVNSSGVITALAPLSPGPGYPVGGALYAPGTHSVLIADGGGGHAEDQNFIHCGIAGWHVGFENTSSYGQAYGSRFFGDFGGAGVAGQSVSPTMFLIGNYGGDQVDVHGCDFTMQPSPGFPAYLLTTGGEDGFNVFGGRIENCSGLVNFLHGTHFRVMVQGLQPTNVTGPLFAGDMGLAMVTIRDTVLAPGTPGPLSQSGINYNQSRIVLDGCDLGYTDISGLTSGATGSHYSLRDVRNDAQLNDLVVPVAPQTATYVYTAPSTPN